ncbi:helix-turn-helix domain-containing protein [Enterococcus sp. 5H]|uniref:helix-turn-helix domain-containing protein n=1 Tax=Enterococcus sp. 5H TaxID=1229490 RepID=UPI002303B14D|nr:helix-turn-helix domain-containing protein [Enterococcus sp. 5H]
MEYSKIFDFESNKLLELFTLLNTANDVYSIEELSSKLQVDPKTILKYIKKLGELFELYYLADQLTISNIIRNQFYLKKDNELVSEQFLINYLNSLPEIIFLKSIIEGNKIQTMQFAETLSISESSLRRRVRKISNWLEHRNLYLKRGTYELIGDEAQIRAFILHFYWFVYRGIKNSFLQQENEESTLLTNHILHFFQLQVNDLQKESILRIVQITNWRYQKGKEINFKEEWYQYITASRLFSKFVEALRHTESTFLQNMDELAYVYLTIQASFLPYYGKSLQGFTIQEHFLEKTTSYMNTLCVANNLKQKFWEKEFDFTQENLAAFLSFHLYYEMIYGFSFERDQSVPIIKEKYPAFSAKLEAVLLEVVNGNSYLNIIPKSNQFYRYFMILTSVISPIYYERKIVICIMTDFSIEKEHELGKRLRHFFYGKFNMTVIYARTSKSIFYANVILTTIIHQRSFKNYERPIVLLDTNFSETIFFEIEELIKVT